MNSADDSPQSRELDLVRLSDAPPETVYRAWTDPALLMQWFTPKPWSVASAERDVRPGGTDTIVMGGPDGAEFPNSSVYLEVVENEKLVFAGVYTEAWEPSEKPFLTAIITFENEDGKTRYTARVQHWSAADRKAHEEMGFHEGWSTATGQLAELVAGL